MNHADKWFDADKMWSGIAWKLPRRLVYWCAIRVGAHATQGKWSNQEVPALTLMDALKRWEDDERRDQGRGVDHPPADKR